MYDIFVSIIFDLGVQRFKLQNACLGACGTPRNLVLDKSLQGIRVLCILPDFVHYKKQKR